uniref:Uncharacterized protein n=1 Tax=Anopheles coluzzii TaxID=1518534 RepID=A0A8W7PPN6_ANOCL
MGPGTRCCDSSDTYLAVGSLPPLLPPPLPLLQKSRPLSEDSLLDGFLREVPPSRWRERTRAQRREEEEGLEDEEEVVVVVEVPDAVVMLATVELLVEPDGVEEFSSSSCWTCRMSTYSSRLDAAGYN